MKQVNVAIIDSGIQLNALCESARNNTQNGYIINGGTVLSIAGIKRDRAWYSMRICDSSDRTGGKTNTHMHTWTKRKMQFETID